MGHSVGSRSEPLALGTGSGGATKRELWSWEEEGRDGATAGWGWEGGGSRGGGG